MSIKSGKHKFGDIEGTRVTFVEQGADEKRVAFLKALLELNGFEVLTTEDKRKNEEDPITYTVAVTDMSFNAVIAVYNRSLKTHDGRKVTPDYWNQSSEETNPKYWKGEV